MTPRRVLATIATTFGAAATALGVLAFLLTDPWHRHAALTTCAVLATLALLVGLIAWQEAPKPPAGAGRSPDPAPAGPPPRRPR